MERSQDPLRSGRSSDLKERSGTHREPLIADGKLETRSDSSPPQPTKETG